MSSVAMHEAEDFSIESMTAHSIEAYVDCSIYEFFHITLLEFLELPHDIVEMLIEITSKKKSQKNDLIASIETSLK